MRKIKKSNNTDNKNKTSLKTMVFMNVNELHVLEKIAPKTTLYHTRL